MSVEEIRKRAEQSKVQAHRERSISIGALATILIASVVNILLPTPHPLRAWVLGLEMVAWTVWFIYLQPPSLSNSSSSIMTLDLSSKSTSCLEFYRRELESRQERAKRGYRVIASLGVFVIAFLLFGIAYRSAVLPLCLLMLVALVIQYLRLKWDGPKVDAELRDLEAFQRR
jgi:hypothetical protein